MRRLVPVALAPALVLALPFAGVGSAAGPSIEAVLGPGGYAWSPATATIAAGGSVTFKNPSGGIPHGVSWTGGPDTPSCAEVPIDEGGTSWTGACTFDRAGTFAFRCTVHPVEMKGTITVTDASGAPPPPEPPPASGPVAASLELAGRQRGMLVHGSIEILRGGPGSRLEVGLSVAAQRYGAMAGRLVRSSPADGTLRFGVPLRKAARKALRRLATLRLRVTVTATASDGESLRRTRPVVMLVGSPGGE